MKWLVALFSILALLLISLLYKFPNICDKPLSYSIGSIDNRFKLTHEQVRQDVKEAETNWETASGQDLFIYDPTADSPVIIQMVYDERQAIAAKVDSGKNYVEQDKTSLQSVVKDFNRRSNELEKKVEEFNLKVLDQNKDNSLSEEEYKKLVEEQTELAQKTKQINAEARTLQERVSNVNVKIDQLNGDISTLQTVVKARPEVGLYETATKTISIYYNTSRRELIHTIEHELGHSIGIGHVADPLAIMYVLTHDSVLLTSDDLHALSVVCKKETLIDIIKSGKWKWPIAKLLMNSIIQR